MTNSQLTIYPCGLIVQWIEHCTGIARSWVLVPFKPEIFSGCFFNCLSWKHTARITIPLISASYSWTFTSCLHMAGCQQVSETFYKSTETNLWCTTTFLQNKIPVLQWVETKFNHQRAFFALLSWCCFFRNNYGKFFTKKWLLCTTWDFFAWNVVTSSAINLPKTATSKQGQQTQQKCSNHKSKI